MDPKSLFFCTRLLACILSLQERGPRSRTVLMHCQDEASAEAFLASVEVLLKNEAQGV